MVNKLLFEKKGFSLFVTSNLWSQEEIFVVKKTIDLVLSEKNQLSI